MRQRVLLETLIVVAAAAILLYVLSFFTNQNRWHSTVLSDEVGYVSVAGNLLEKGEMRSGIIYTSTLKQKTYRNYPYMPGHYWSVALAFVLTGVGRAQAIAPSLVAYCLAAACVYLTGRKLYGSAAGFAAAAVFAILPACLAYAFTAMSELTFIAAISTAFCVFVHLPQVLRVWGGPVLLAVPFLFRETGSLLVIPMASMILGGFPLIQRISRDRWRDAAVFCILSVALLAYLYESPLCGPRPSLMKMMLFDVPVLDIYYSATAEDGIPKGVGPWAKAVVHNVVRNVKALQLMPASKPAGMELGCIAAVLLGMLLALGAGVRRRDAAAFGAGLMALTAVGLIWALYAVSGFRGMRNLLFLWPMLALPVGAWLAGIISIALRRPALMAVLVVIQTAIVAASFSVATQMFAVFATNDQQDDEAAKFVESINHDPKRLLASPVSMGLPYLIRHPEATWAFLPRDGESLSLLARRYDIGTLIVPRGLMTLKRAHLLRRGFVPDGEVLWQKQPVQIYKRPVKTKKTPSTQPTTKPTTRPTTKPAVKATAKPAPRKKKSP